MRQRFTSLHRSTDSQKSKKQPIETPPPSDKRQNHEARRSKEQDGDSWMVHSYMSPISIDIDDSTNCNQAAKTPHMRQCQDTESAKQKEKPRQVAKCLESHRSVNPVASDFELQNGISKAVQKKRGRMKKIIQVEKIAVRSEKESKLSAAKKGDNKKRQTSKQNTKRITTRTVFYLENEGVPAKKAKKLKATTSKTTERRCSTTSTGRRNHSLSDLKDIAGPDSARPRTKKKEKGDGKRRKKEPAQCKMCCQLVKGRVAMERHMLTHTGEKPFECDDCGRRYSSSSNLRIHQQIHTGKMDYSCELCSQKFTHLSYLKVHVLRHTGKRPHTCDQCGKGFIQKYHLKRHLLVHSKKITYTCDKCDATFNRTDYLRLHMRNVHLTEYNETEPNKPFKCDMCEKAFTNRTSLKMHGRVHTGVTPFSCSICQRKFKQSSQMHSHMRTHSGVKPYACDVCGMKFLRKNYVRVHKEKKHLLKSNFILNKS